MPPVDGQNNSDSDVVKGLIEDAKENTDSRF